MKSLTLLFLMALSTFPLAAAPIKEEADVPPYALPAPLVDAADHELSTAAAWAEHRPQLLAQFAQQMYGRTLLGKPAALKFRVLEERPDARGGRATRLRVLVMFEGTETGRHLELLVYLPNDVTGPVPLFLGLNFDGNYTTTDDPDLPVPTHHALGLFANKLADHRPTAAGRGMHKYEWPVDFILEAGWGVATAACGEIEPDENGAWQQGVRGLAPEPGAEDWGTIGAWAWGLSRALDYLQTNDRVDGQRVVLTGFSRLGKAALWAAAQDERFAGVVSNHSGAGGLALSKRLFGETVADLTQRFPHWFARSFAQYAEKEATLPFDQHQLIALIAPRPVLGVSGVQDLWSDPRGEFLTLKAASPVYELLGHGGLKVMEMPKPGQLVNGKLGYYLHAGGHDVGLEDWRAMLSWGSSQFKGPQESLSASDRYARRLAALPAAEQAAWKHYFSQSDAFRRQHDEQLAAECQAHSLPAPQPAPAAGGEINLPQPPTASEAELLLAQTLISFQVPAGGWSKHVKYETGPRQPGMAWTSQENPAHYAGTFDNRATTKQLEFLALLQTLHPEAAIKASVEKGIDYLLAAQFPNGGWPQGYPLEGNYHDAITLNDGAMPHIIDTLRLISTGKSGFAWVDAARQTACAAALARGVAALLQMQYRIAGQPTIWGAQHDLFTLRPVGARGFELVGLSGGESVDVLRTLFLIRPATPELRAAVNAACDWFAAHALPATAEGQPTWGRFIDLETQQAFFPGKTDGRSYDTLEELKKHNPTGYDYAVTKPGDLPKWRAQWLQTLTKEAGKQK